MIRLTTKFIDSELQVLNELLGTYEILTFVEGKFFALSEYGENSYFDCFECIEDDFFMQQKYELMKPKKVIKFYQYYIVETEEEPGIWYRGILRENGNYELDCCGDTLQEIIWSL